LSTTFGNIDAGNYRKKPISSIAIPEKMPPPTDGGIFSGIVVIALIIPGCRPGKGECCHYI
jgi:hypothetical protein